MHRLSIWFMHYLDNTQFVHMHTHVLFFSYFFLVRLNIEFLWGNQIHFHLFFIIIISHHLTFFFLEFVNLFVWFFLWLDHNAAAHLYNIFFHHFKSNLWLSIFFLLIDFFEQIVRYKFIKRENSSLRNAKKKMMMMMMNFGWDRHLNYSMK